MVLFGPVNKTRSSNLLIAGKTKPNNKTTKNRNFKVMNCSPLVKGVTYGKETCLPNKTLIKLRDSYNSKHPDNKINSKRPNDIWIGLKNNITNCDKEDCWLSHLPDNERTFLEEKVFAPDQPPEWSKNHNEWLSNYDIFEVLSQYEDKYKNFTLLGPTAIDFDAKPNGSKCVTEEICKISLQALQDKKINKIGIVFNLDKHNEPGSHWTSMFIDFGARIIFYFDSAANETPPEIENLRDRIIAQGKALTPKKINFKYYQNYPHNHQNTNTECGMYSLFFIITMLTGKLDNVKPISLNKRLSLFKQKRISDSHVENYRDIYFNR